MHLDALQHINPMVCCDDRNTVDQYLRNLPACLPDAAGRLFDQFGDFRRVRGHQHVRGAGDDKGFFASARLEVAQLQAKKSPLLERAESISCEEVEETEA